MTNKLLGDVERLWTSRELAAYLRYEEATIKRLVSQAPDKLPPRITILSRPRWDPLAVKQWVQQNTAAQAGVARRRGRPRMISSTP